MHIRCVVCLVLISVLSVGAGCKDFDDRVCDSVEYSTARVPYECVSLELEETDCEPGEPVVEDRKRVTCPETGKAHIGEITLKTDHPVMREQIEGFGLDLDAGGFEAPIAVAKPSPDEDAFDVGIALPVPTPGKYSDAIQFRGPRDKEGGFSPFPEESEGVRFTQKAPVGWSFEPGAEISLAPAYDGDRIFVGAGEKFYALDAENGEELWSAELFGMAISPPTVADGVVYVVAHKGVHHNLHVFDAEDGEELPDAGWKSRKQTSNPELPAPVVEGDLVAVFRHTQLAVYSPRDDDSSLERVESFDVHPSTAADIDDGRLVYADSTRDHDGDDQPRASLVVVDLESGEQLLDEVLDEAVASDPQGLSISDGFAFFGSRFGGVHRISLEDGSVDWIFDTEHGTDETVVDGDTVFAQGATAAGKGVLAIDRESGDQRWSTDTEDHIWSSLSPADDGLYFVAGKSQMDQDQNPIGTYHLFDLDAESGEVEKKYLLEQRDRPEQFVPVVGADMVYLATGASELLAIER